jgi:hypothetical protein
MKIAMYDLEGHLLEVLEAETYQGIIDLLPVKSSIKSTASIQQATRGEINFCGGYQFREVFTKKPLQKIGSCIDLKKAVEKQVQKYYKGVYICTYKNIEEAAFINNILRDNIGKCARGIRATAGGFEWKFVV